MRRTPTPAITARMYRHFAVVTLLITGLVAFFANGQQQQAQAAESADQPEAQMGKVREPFPLPTTDPASGDSGTWGGDDGDFGSPTDGGQATLGGSDSLAQPYDGDDDDGTADQGDGDRPTAAQIAAVEAASRLRSGSADSD